MTTFCLLNLTSFFVCLLIAYVWLRIIQPLMYSELETIRGDFQYVKKKQRHLTDSRFHSVPIDLVFLLFSSVFSAGFDSERNLRCGFAQRHLTISWNWHRSSVTGIVCYLMYNTGGQYITEQSDEMERQPPLCSFCWCQYRRRSF